MPDHTIIEEARRIGLSAGAGHRSLTHLWIRVAEEVAHGRMSFRQVGNAYDAYVESAGKKPASRNVQIWKLEQVYYFALLFREPAIDYLRRWRQFGIPNIPMNMLPSHLKDLTDRRRNDAGFTLDSL